LRNFAIEGSRLR